MKRTYQRKLTLWFKGDTHPMRPGVYQISASGSYHHRGSGVLYCYWNGAQWGSGARNPYLANEDICKVFPHRFQNLAWRGRTQP